MVPYYRSADLSVHRCRVKYNSRGYEIGCILLWMSCEEEIGRLGRMTSESEYGSGIWLVAKTDITPGYELTIIGDVNPHHITRVRLVVISKLKDKGQYVIAFHPIHRTHDPSCPSLMHHPRPNPVTRAA